MLLRLATPDDHEVVGRATVAAYSPFIGGERPDTGYVEQLRDAARRAEEAELWVACSQDGAVLGSVTICPEGSPWRELARPGEGEFRMLAVDPAAQGQGVGRALVEHALEHFRSGGATGVVLCSMAEMTAAHALYGRLGFTREPALDWSPAPGVELLSFRLTFRDAGVLMTDPATTSLTFVVGEADTALAVGSGSLPVLGTPRLLAWLEAATCAAIEPALPEGSTSVGTRMTLEHLVASPVGQEVEVTASSSYVDGRLHRFTVAARHVSGGAAGKVVGTGEVTRVVVDADKFLGRISPPS